jgi:hypothetical protein
MNQWITDGFALLIEEQMTKFLILLVLVLFQLRD